MPPASQRRKGVLDRPGRLAAVGGAAIVCILTVSGALGLPHGPGSAAGETGSRDAVLQTGVAPPTEAATNTPSPDNAGVSGADHRQRDTEPGRSSHHAEPAADTALPASSGSGRRVVFDESSQRVWLVTDSGSVARTYPVSGSKYDNLATGTYAVSSRSEHATAYNSNETMRFMVRFAYGRTAPIGFHSIPAHPDGTLAEARSELGTPLSDGCIRQWITDARALWNFAPVGTKVVVLA